MLEIPEHGSTKGVATTRGDIGEAQLTNLEPLMHTEVMFASPFDHRAITELLGTQIRREERTGIQRRSRDINDDRERYCHVTDSLFGKEVKSAGKFHDEIESLCLGHWCMRCVPVLFQRQNWLAHPPVTSQQAADHRMKRR